MVGKEKAEKLDYMDPTTFTNYYVAAEKAHKAALKAQFEKEKKEAEAKKNNGKKDDQLMVLADDKTKTEVDPAKDGFKELQEV